MKMAIVRPTQSYLQKTSLFLRYHITAHKTFVDQLFPQSNGLPSQVEIFDHTPGTKEKEENIIAMIEKIDQKSLFPSSVTTNRGLVNVFSNLKATPEQSHDLLNFRTIGHDSLINYINHYLLRVPSINPPVRRNKLLTMAPPKKADESKRKGDETSY